MFNECIARHYRATIGGSHLPASNSKQEAEDVGLLLFLELLDVFEGTHLFSQIMCQYSVLQTALTTSAEYRVVEQTLNVRYDFTWWVETWTLNC